MLAIRELRRSLGLSRSQLAQLVGCSAETIERYEVTIPAERLKQFASIATEHGLHDLANELRSAAGQETKQAPKAEPTRVAPLTVDEQKLLSDLAAEIRKNPQLIRLLHALLDALADTPRDSRAGRPQSRRGRR